MKTPVLFMVELGSLATGLAGARCRRNEGKPINSMANRFFRARLLFATCAIMGACLVAVLTLAPVSCAFGQTYYEMTVHNNFGPREFYNATPQTSQIWLLTNFQFDYQTSGGWTVGNATAGSYASVNLSAISQGKIRIHRANGGTRMYAVLSNTQPAAVQPDPATFLQPNSYFEWSFDGTGVPGTLDLSWIDRWDFLTRLEVSNLPSSAPTMVYGSQQGQSTAAVGAAMAGYASQPQYSWLSSFSQTLSFPGATYPIGWVTRNQYSGSGFASGIGSFTNLLNQVITTAANSTPWRGFTAGIGPNWTTAGFRVGYPETLNDPATGTNTGSAWTAYVGFTKDGSGSYTMSLTDFTLYNNSGNYIWSAVNNAGGAVYQVTQAQGVLDCIWTSSWNNLTSTPTWVANLGSNSPNVMYAIYNALASGVIYKDVFVNNTPLPAWPGYVPRILGVTNYNFEILTAGAPVTGGLAGLLNGQDMISLLDNQANALVNPYMLVLLRTQEVTPAYLFPSQDVWAFIGTAGASPVLGLQTGPLNGQAAFGDNAKLDWYLGGGGGRNVGSIGSLMLLLLN
ncbi:MAG: hypothetical protein AB1424_17360 [Thermodesulfobacteriota bacterium]